VKTTALENRSRLSIREKGQYVLAFFVVASMLFFVGLPVFLLFFFGVLTYFIWKAFSSEPHGSAKDIFEFYLVASEILRRDDRNWFGFEIRKAIAMGQALASEHECPPLLYFALGALCQKAGEHDAAVEFLSRVDSSMGKLEESIVIPTKELEEYVRILRKIERSPVDAPLTHAAVRNLERLRKTRAAEMLDFSRSMVNGQTRELHSGEVEGEPDTQEKQTYSFAEFAQNRKAKIDPDVSAERRTISEVLHDIYDDQAEG
jgi:hypothetical protein